ncbi:calcium-binding tyrosine phosphorylation-regulated protein-like [Chironomus tepperi]|uniref:calcium-binding tyrosine phosphorylation-regulated protein-like n=1 Tax=Chironomus tepperi TaxID=113505 RepID=UPI00391F283E
MPRITPKIPQGLEELMLNLAKSIIKENPQNLYEFAAEYFEKLLKERDGKVDESYKKLPVYKAYKRAKLERNRLEVEGIKVELEARRRTGSAQTSRSINRSSSATKNVEKLPKIASSSAEAESGSVEAENPRKSAKKLPNISGTATKIAVGAGAVGIAAAAVKPALMAVKPQRKSQEIVDYNENSEIVHQSSSDDGSNNAGTETSMIDSGVDLSASGDDQMDTEINIQNLEASEINLADLEQNSDETQAIEPQESPKAPENEASDPKYLLILKVSQNQLNLHQTTSWNAQRLT